MKKQILTCISEGNLLAANNIKKSAYFPKRSDNRAQESTELKQDENWDAHSLSANNYYNISRNDTYS